MRVMALTIRQPWAELIMAGLKGIENRTQRASYTGILLIHAAKRWDEKWFERFSSGIALREAHAYLAKRRIARMGHMNWQQGEVIGMCVMTGCDTIQNSRWCNNGCFYWRLMWPYRFKKSFPVHGRLGLFGVRITPVEMTTADWRKVLEYKKECIRMGLMEEEKEDEEETDAAE